MPPITASASMSTPLGKHLVAGSWAYLNPWKPAASGCHQRDPRGLGSRHQRGPRSPGGRRSSTSTRPGKHLVGRSVTTVWLQCHHSVAQGNSEDPPIRHGLAFEKSWVGRGAGVC